MQTFVKSIKKYLTLRKTKYEKTMGSNAQTILTLNTLIQWRF